MTVVQYGSLITDSTNGKYKMSGIFLHFDPLGLSPKSQKRFLELARSRITRYPQKAVEHIEGNFISGAASHYGIMPSGGVAEKKSNFLISTGSCWTTPEATSLATPMEILEDWGKSPIHQNLVHHQCLQGFSQTNHSGYPNQVHW